MDKFNYLYMAANALPSETASQRVLKSLYLTKARKLFGREDREHGDLKFNSTKCCPRCNSLWSDGDCRITITKRPSVKCKNRRKCRQLVTKHYCYGTKKGRFTKLSRFLARKLYEQVTLACGLCGHKELFYLTQRRRKATHLKTIPSRGLTEDTDVQGKRRRNKKKTKFAGLDENVMTSLRDPKAQPKPITKIKPAKKSASGKKAGKPKKSMSKNGMLQLAQLLKSKETSSVNKLELMLK